MKVSRFCAALLLSWSWSGGVEASDVENVLDELVVNGNCSWNSNGHTIDQLQLFVQQNVVDREEVDAILTDITELYEQMSKSLKVVSAPYLGGLIRTMHAIKAEASVKEDKAEFQWRAIEGGSQGWRVVTGQRRADVGGGLTEVPASGGTFQGHKVPPSGGRMPRRSQDTFDLKAMTSKSSTAQVHANNDDLESWESSVAESRSRLRSMLMGPVAQINRDLEQRLHHLKNGAFLPSRPIPMNASPKQAGDKAIFYSNKPMTDREFAVKQIIGHRKDRYESVERQDDSPEDAERDRATKRTKAKKKLMEKMRQRRKKKKESGIEKAMEYLPEPPRKPKMPRHLMQRLKALRTRQEKDSVQSQNRRRFRQRRPFYRDLLHGAHTTKHVTLVPLPPSPPQPSKGSSHTRVSDLTKGHFSLSTAALLNNKSTPVSNSSASGTTPVNSIDSDAASSSSITTTTVIIKTPPAPASKSVPPPPSPPTLPAALRQRLVHPDPNSVMVAPPQKPPHVPRGDGSIVDGAGSEDDGDDEEQHQDDGGGNWRSHIDGAFQAIMNKVAPIASGLVHMSAFFAI